MSKEGDFTLNEDDDDDEDAAWQGEEDAAWTNDLDEGEAEGDVKDESAAYLEFLNEEVNSRMYPDPIAILTKHHMLQAKKFHAATAEDDDELEEESLLETPLDKVEPYGIFKGSLLSRFSPSSNPLKHDLQQQHLR